MAEPGDIVAWRDEKRVVVDVTGDGWSVLRYTDDDPRRQFDQHGGDIHFDGAESGSLTVVGRIS